jgi:hypothetical protein
MTAIIWDEVGSHTFEGGVDRGVLYFQDDGHGIPWNGLLSVDENPSASVTPVFYDGRKINDLAKNSSFSGRLRAYTYPDEFMQFEGVVEDSVGFYVAEQPLKRFNLSYRTKIGNEVVGLEQGYRIHILYDVTAVPSTKSYKTLGQTTTPSEFEWTITTIPKDISGYQPTSHIIIDTRNSPDWFIADIESLLYGSDEQEPFLPSLESFASFFRNWNRIIVFDNGDGTWTASTTRDDAIILLGGGEFQIIDANAVFIDANTYEFSSTDRNDDDIWLP